jgi:hybrid cluster-associated redox disulfide protein
MDRIEPVAIDEAATVDEVLNRYPATARVFIRRRMQCVGCEVARFETIVDACGVYGQPTPPFLAELRQAATQAATSTTDRGQEGGRPEPRGE